MKQSRSIPTATTAGLPWLGLTILVILSIGLLLPIQPNDYWWYVRLGQDIVRQGAIPTLDTYSYTQAGQPMVYHPWLAAVLFWLLESTGGFTLTVLVRGLLLTFFYVLIWQTCRLAGAGPVLATVLTVAAALTGSHNWATRPQLFSFPLFGLALWVLWQWQQGQQRYLWLLPVGTALWVNLHGAFILGFLLVGAALLGGGDRKRLLIALAAMLLATLLNPRFVGAWSYVFTLLTNPPSQQLSAEWSPPTVQGWQGTLFFAWLLLSIPLAAFSRARLSWTQWLWFLGFGWMALSGLRYVIWFLAILAPLTAQMLAAVLAQPSRRFSLRGHPIIDWPVFILLVLLPLSVLPGLRERWWSATPPVLSSTTPVEATAWLKDQPDIPGPLWSDIAFSSYLIYALPERPVWNDTRFELYPLSQWEQYVDISEAAPTWQAHLDEYGVNLLMIDPYGQTLLLQAVRDSQEWTERYGDDSAVIFIRER